MSWIWPVLAGLVASTATLIGSGLILMIGKRAEGAAVWLLSFAIGTLLGTATLGLLPEALEHAPAERTMALLLAGILVFVIFERVLRWRHPHLPHPEAPHHPAVERATATMVLWGDAFHNLIDGLVLGIAFGVDVEMGLAASLAIIAHEVPQEIGDFAVLLASGMPKGRAFALNYLVALTPIPGALLMYSWTSGSADLLGWLLPIAAGGFFYIALADLVPALHHRRGAAAAMLQVFLIVLGVIAVWTTGLLHRR
ncbi:MAG: ZIP family metal transporter [Deltaproteobacteria bacterium]|nr:ZIP family metal transporter [Deltaproteobacteria bacterium]